MQQGIQLQVCAVKDEIGNDLLASKLKEEDGYKMSLVFTVNEAWKRLAYALEQKVPNNDAGGYTGMVL